jgi:predicted phage tail protein
MTTLKTVYLHGILGEKYGHEHHFVLNNVREAISALQANYDGFRADYFRYPFYGVICDGDNRHPGNCPDVAMAPFSRDIHLVPMIEGRITGIILAGLAAINISGTIATVLAGVIQVGLLFGISLLLAPKPPDTDQKKDENYMFSGPENTTTQGSPVPLIYGRCFVGSVVGSAGVDVAQGAGSEEGEGANYIWHSTGGTVTDLSQPVQQPFLRTRLAVDAPVVASIRDWRPPNG